MAEDVGELVIRAVAPEDVAGRRAAFDALVGRFQDMAFAYAYGRLGDRGLAEDAAQEAFVSAWLNLRQLRTPEAFPGWFRQILARQCSRVASGREEAVDSAALDVPAPPSNDPATRVETLDLREWIAGLPEHERTAVLLFYVGDQSLKEVGALLGITPNAVKQRLFSARKRLRGRMTRQMTEELNKQRPSRNEGFAEEVRLKVRAFGGDYEALADLIERSEAGAPPEHLDVDDDRREWLANRRVFDAQGLIPRAYTVERRDNGETLAYGCIERVDKPKTGEYPPTGRPGVSTYRVHVVAVEGAVEAGAVASLYGRLERDALSLGAETIWCRDTSEHLDVVDVLRGVGFEELYRVNEWHVSVGDWPVRSGSTEVASPLPAVDGSQRQRKEPVIDWSQRQGKEPAVWLQRDRRGLVVTTLAREMAAGRDCVSLLHALWNASGGRPGRVEPLLREQIEERLARPHVVPESYFLAVKAGRVVGVLVLRRPHASAGSKADFGFRVLTGGEDTEIEGALLGAAVDYGRSHGVSTMTAYFWDEDTDSAYLDGVGLRPSVQLIVLEKRLLNRGGDRESAGVERGIERVTPR
jgi:RNA polymerase sigma factor (sigma-70 family)